MNDRALIQDQYTDEDREALKTVQTIAQTLTGILGTVDTDVVTQVQ
ncbi:hypothetical protein J2W54_004948 [Rhodococcus fascians]|nr:hypothetical protein [Rhodococcus sp. 3258]MDR6934532.1 hypothetical protein [Rhodococcus fascians]